MSIVLFLIRKVGYDVLLGVRLVVELEAVGVPFAIHFNVERVFIIGMVFHCDDGLFFYHHFERVFGSVEVGSCATEPAIKRQ